MENLGIGDYNPAVLIGASCIEDDEVMDKALSCPPETLDEFGEGGGFITFHTTQTIPLLKGFTLCSWFWFGDSFERQSEKFIWFDSNHLTIALELDGNAQRVYLCISGSRSKRMPLTGFYKLCNVWFHLAISVDEEGRIRIFLNGQPLGGYLGSPAFVPAAPLRLSSCLMNQTHVDFKVLHFRLYDSAIPMPIIRQVLHQDSSFRHLIAYVPHALPSLQASVPQVVNTRLGLTFETWAKVPEFPLHREPWAWVSLFMMRSGINFHTQVIFSAEIFTQKEALPAPEMALGELYLSVKYKDLAGEKEEFASTGIAYKDIAGQWGHFGIVFEPKGVFFLYFNGNELIEITSVIQEAPENVDPDKDGMPRVNMLPMQQVFWEFPEERAAYNVEQKGIRIYRHCLPEDAISRDMTIDKDWE